MKRFSALLTLAAVAGFSLVGCGGSSTTATMPTSSGMATVSASMMDGPFRTSGGTVTAVNITISKVQLIGTGGTTTIATFSPSMPVNLLNFTTTALVLGTGQVPPGTYTQLRLLLDTSNPNNTSVVINGTTSPLSIPSATGPIGFSGNVSTDNGDGAGTSGIKVNINLTAVAGQTYGFLIDFNAAESIVVAGNSGTILMKPVLVATVQNLAGSISGTVKNNAGVGVSNAEVVAMQGTTAINSGVTDANGNFTINALPAGAYTLVVNNTWTNLAGMAQVAVGADTMTAITFPSLVTVTAGQTTTVTITD
jgi:uncharacterized protein DUF4382/carboxypeptidase family protein